RGVRTVLVDADLGMANLDIMAGVRPAHSAAEWLGGRVTLAECFVAVAPRMWLLGGASGLARMADLSPAQRQRLVEGLSHVASHVDLMVLDLGAGIGAGTLELAGAADRVLMVTTPEPTALTDAYGFMKACVRGGRRTGWNVACSMATDAAAGARGSGPGGRRRACGGPRGRGAARGGAGGCTRRLGSGTRCDSHGR
ncbi:MAG: hypothetical protein ACKOF7_08085, partial [Phycisphaerales bacterium]